METDMNSILVKILLWLISARKGKIIFLQYSDTEFIYHIPRQAPITKYLDNTKCIHVICLNIFCLIVFFIHIFIWFILIERDGGNKVGYIGRLFGSKRRWMWERIWIKYMKNSLKTVEDQNISGVLVVCTYSLFCIVVIWMLDILRVYL